MGLITKRIEVEISGRNKPYYNRRGYLVPEAIDNYGKISTPRGVKVIVSVDDLPKNSQYKVNIKCDYCGETFSRTWQVYMRNVKDNGIYYCRKCALKLYGTNNRVKSALKNSISFEQWCINQKRQDVIDRWDYDKNKLQPNQVCFSSRNKYYFKCPKNIHKSELKNISSFTGKQGSEIYCSQCNSFAQWGIDNLGNDFLKRYWDYQKNKISPWNIDKLSNRKIWIKCQEKDYHGSYKITCSNFTYGGRCSLCNRNSGNVHILDSLGSLYPKSIEMWSTKNNKSPYEYPSRSGYEVWWKCESEKHEDYIRDISSSVIYNFRCPECVKERNESFLQEKIRLYIINLEYNILHEYNCNLKCVNSQTNRILPYDNEVEELKLIIEVHGSQHYKEASGTWFDENFDLKYQQWKDKYKKDYALSQGYFYLEIPYWTDDEEETWKKLIDDKIKEIKYKKEVV